MKKLGVWIGLNGVLLFFVFSGTKSVSFSHFWQKWEFLAALTAGLYSAVFVVIGLLYSEQPGGKTLHDALQRRFNIAFYLIARAIVPLILFCTAAFVIWGDRKPADVPVDAASVFSKLVLTFFAFAAICAADMVSAHHLRTKNPSTENDHLWAQHLRRHAWMIDLPLVVGYAGLIIAYQLHRTTPEGELFLQAFVGGASAFEMLVLSAVHGLEEFADHETSSLFTIPSDRSVRSRA